MKIFVFDVFLLNWQEKHFNNFFKKSVHGVQSYLNVKMTYL